jgi:hypothetical protein
MKVTAMPTSSNRLMNQARFHPAMQGRIWALMLVLALALPAGAQEASFTVTQETVPAGEEIEAGESLTFAFNATLEGEGFSCATDVEAPVNATVSAELPSDAPDNASVEPGNASKAFPIQAGNYQTEPYNQSASYEIPVETGSGVTENYSATLSVESVFPGGTYDNCVPSEFPEAASEVAKIRLDVTADDPEPEEPVDEEPEQPANDTNETTTPPANETANETTEDDEGSTGIPTGAHLVPIAFVGAALLAGARREE